MINYIICSIYPLFFGHSPRHGEAGSIGGAISNPAEELHQLFGTVTGLMVIYRYYSN
jgi:hypothetical protein